MKRTFTASVWQEDDLFVPQRLYVDVASQGGSKAKALANLRETLERSVEVEGGTTTRADRLC